MAWFTRKKERYSVEDEIPKWSNGEFVLNPNRIRGRKTGPVSKKEMLSIPAVWSAVNFISKTIAGLPIHIVNSSGRKEKGHLYRLLNGEVSDRNTSNSWRYKMMKDAYTIGISVSTINRTGSGTIKNIDIRETDKVQIERERNSGLVYHIRDGLTTKTRFRADEVIDVRFADEGATTDILRPNEQWSDFFRYCINIQNYASNYFSRGGLPQATLTGPFEGKKSMANIMQSFEKTMQAAQEKGAIYVPIPAEHKLETIGHNPQDSQLEQTRRFSVEETARIFQIPVVFLQDYTNGTYSNTEQMGIQLSKHTITPIVSNLESELSFKLFGRNSSKKVRFELDDLQRGDWASRIAGEAQQVQNGLRTINEVRESDGLPPLKGGDDIVIQQNMIPIGELANLVNNKAKIPQPPKEGGENGE